MHSKRVNSGADFLNIEHIPIERSEVHPQYNPDTWENDVWMIKLQWPSQLYANQLVDLETPADNVLLAPGDNIQAMGFGLLTDGGVTPNVLQEVTLDVISSAACNAAYPGEILPGMFCTETTNGVDTCNVSCSCSSVT
jgi:trypsin